jgi:transposase
MSRPIGTAEELERRRERAVQAVAASESRKTVAKVLGIHVKTVSRWVRAAREPNGLASKPQPGPTPGLTDADLRRLGELLAKGAKAHGWHNELWTAARVARLIKRHFHIDYHPEHVRKILKRRLGWTSQKPRRKARERNDKEVARWLDDEFARIVREAFRRRVRIAGMTCMLAPGTGTLRGSFACSRSIPSRTSCPQQSAKRREARCQ